MCHRLQSVLRMGVLFLSLYSPTMVQFQKVQYLQKEAGRTIFYPAVVSWVTSSQQTKKDVCVGPCGFATGAERSLQL